MQFSSGIANQGHNMWGSQNESAHVHGRHERRHRATEARHHRRDTRPLSRSLAVLLLAPLLVVTTFATPAAAVLVGDFEIDGNTPVDTVPNKDWANTGTHVTDPVGNADTTTFKGSKEFEHPSTWVQGTGLAPNQDDVSDVYFHDAVVGDDVYAYIGFRRFTTSGTTNFDVELNQLANSTVDTYVPTRSVGDLMVRFEQDGNSSFSLTNAYVWRLWSATTSPTGWNAGCIEVPGYTPRAGWCSISLASSGFVGATGENGHFAEGAFNLSDLLGETTCRGAFGTMNLRSFTGNSNESSLKDYIEPVAISIDSNCGRLQIRKVDQFGNAVGGATFTISPNPIPGGTGVLTVVDGGLNDPDGQADGSITIDPATPGTYTVVETVAPPGYELPPLADRTFTVVVGENGVGSSGPARVVDRRYFQPPTMTNTPTATYDIDYNWRVLKSVDRNRADVAAGDTAPFDYTVQLEALAPTTSGHELGGTLDVTNPNSLDMVATIDVGITGGSACTIDAVDIRPAAGLQVNLDSGGNQFTYTCTPGADPANGSTTANLAWSSTTYPQAPPAGAYEINGPAAGYTWTIDESTDASTTVTDTFDGGTPENLGTFDWTTVYGAADSNHKVTVATYTRNLGSPAGECRTYPNTARESADETTAGESVTVCSGAVLDVTKDAFLGYQRVLLWDIDKSGPGTVFTGRDDQGNLRRMVRYSIDVSADGVRDSDWALTGTIKVDNPNDWPVTVTVTDTVVVDTRPSSCTVAGGDAQPGTPGQQVVIPADAVDHALTYECTGVQQGDYVGENTVSIDWSGDSHVYARTTDSATASVVVNGDPDPANSTITLSDLLDGKDVTGDLPQTSFDWADVNGEAGDETANPPIPAHTQRIFYEVALGTTADACTPHLNTVTINETEQSDSHTVTVCSPGIDKGFDATYKQIQRWSLTKDVDETRIEVAEGDQATFNYTVRATPGDVVPEAGTATWTGSVSVHNPSTTETLTLDLSDTPAVPGWTCEFVDDNTGIELAPGASDDIGYTCSGDGLAGGTNTATATFGGQTVSDSVDVTFVPRGAVTDAVTTLTDDIPDDGLPALQFPVDASEGVNTFTYPRSLTAPAGDCRVWTNTAVLALTGDDLSDSEAVTVCAETAPTLDVSARGSYGVTYDWSIDKEVDRTRVEVDEATGSARFDYTVTVRAGQRTPSGWSMGGTLTVTNPNTYEEGAITLTGGEITSTVGGGVDCDPNDPIAGTTIPVDDSVGIPFTCTFTGEPVSPGTVSASVTWDPAGPAETDTATDSGPATLTVGTETDRFVDVIDDKTDPANPVTLAEDLEWSEGLVRTFDYFLVHEGVSGRCSSFTNTAVVDLAQRPDPTDGTTVRVCVEAPLTAAAQASADLARSYAWSVDKVADATERTVGADGNATFRYTVTARAGAATDSGWRLSGTVTLTNPNTYEDGAITLTGATVTTDLGGGSSCTAPLPAEPVVPAGSTETPGTLTVPFSCTFTGQPAGSGTVDAAVTWDPPGEDDTASAGDDVAVSFAVRSETDKVVDVVDDKTVPGQRTLLESGVVWAAGLVRTYTYDLTLAGGAAGTCQTYTNTAVVDLPAGADATDTAQVRVCAPPPEVLPAQSFGKARGAVRATCQGTVTARMKNNTGERVTYKLRIGKKVRRINVRAEGKRLFQTKGPFRARVTLRAQGRVLDRTRVPRACLPPQVLPATGLRTAAQARADFLAARWR